MSIETKDGLSARGGLEEGARVLIVADDLTGAMDAAGPFATRGMSTWVVALPEACDPARFSRADVVAINTDSRHLPAAEAARRVEQAFALMGGERFALVIKKIDSTLRGNVIAETEALMRATGRTTALALTKPGTSWKVPCQLRSTTWVWPMSYFPVRGLSTGRNSNLCCAMRLAGTGNAARCRWT